MNCKQVQIEAMVPFYWLSPHDTAITDEDAAFIARILLGPTTELEHSWKSLGYFDNDRGGQTAMYTLKIEGVTSMSWKALDRLVEVLLKAHAQISVAMAMDIEDPDTGGWYELGKDSRVIQ